MAAAAIISLASSPIRERRTPTAWRTPSGTSCVARLGQLAQHLLDEERIAVGAGVHARREIVGAQDRPGKRRDLIEREAAQVDAVLRTAALELGQRAGERAVTAKLGVAICAEEEHRPSAT